MKRFLLSRPITILGIISAVHTVVYGLGFMFALGGFEKSRLYQNIDSSMSTNWYGMAMLVIGGITLAGYINKWSRVVYNLSFVQSVIWLFSTAVYVLAGEVMLGIGVALVWAAISQYLAYAYRYIEEVRDLAVLNNKR